MSALVDIWTSELAKMREKGQTNFSNGSSPANAASSQKIQPIEGGSSTGLVQAFSQFMRANSPVSPRYSEASVSMVVEYLSA